MRIPYDAPVAAARIIVETSSAVAVSISQYADFGCVSHR